MFTGKVSEEHLNKLNASWNLFDFPFRFLETGISHELFIQIFIPFNANVHITWKPVKWFE